MTPTRVRPGCGDPGRQVVNAATGASLPDSPDIAAHSTSPGATEEPTTYDRFVAYLDRNPELLDALVRLARQWVDRFGRRRLGVRLLVERARWEMAFTSGDPDFRINNNYCPFLAREIVRRAPDLEGVFTTRASMADRHYSIARWPGSDVRLDGALW
jgi:hypothetical protein